MLFTHVEAEVILARPCLCAFPTEPPGLWPQCPLTSDIGRVSPNTHSGSVKCSKHPRNSMYSTSRICINWFKHLDATVHVQLLQTLEDYTDVELDAKNERLGLENQLWAWDAHATRLLVVCPYNMQFFFHMYTILYSIVYTVQYVYILI